MGPTPPAEEEGPALSEKIIAALLCRGDLSNEQLEAKPCTYSELFRFATGRDNFYMAAGVVLSAVTGCIMPISAVLSGVIANDFLKEKNPVGNDALYASVHKIIILYIVFTIVQFALCFAQQYCFSSGTASVAARFRREFMSAILRQDAEWQDSHSAGELNEQLNANIDRIRDGLGEKLSFVVRGFFMYLSSTTYSFFYNWKVTIVMCALGPLCAMIMGLMARFSANPMKQQMDLSGKAASIVEESVMNIKTVASCNGEAQMVERYAKTLLAARVPSLRVYFLNGFFEGLFFFVLYLFTVFSVLWGIVDAHSIETTLEPGTVVISINTVLMGAYWLGLLGPHMMALLKARIAAAVIYKTVDRDTIYSTGMPAEEEDAPLKGDIEFYEVHFKYPTREAPVLQGITWSAKAGQRLAFVGHSGCGKSTSIGLLTRLYDATGGRILVDARNILEIDPRTLRKNIGIVQQEPYLFNGTIRENIILGRKCMGSEEERINCVVKIAHALEFVEKLDKGLDTVVGEGGVRLSGGQKQRIAIARALFTDPPILVLDEATSALDVQSERLVQEALTEASVGRTSITIAHRLSTLKNSDMIYVLDHGRVVQSGTHDGLMMQEGIYAKLASAQSFETRVKEDEDDADIVIKRDSPYDSGRSSGRKSTKIRASRSSTSPVEEFEIANDEKKKKQETKSTSLRLFSHGNTGKILATVFFSILRGWEVPLFIVQMKLIYDALDAPRESYSGPLTFLCSFSFSIGVYMWIVLTAAYFFAGWSAECVTSLVKERALARILGQEAEYFDREESTNAVTVSDINQQAPNLMAGLDHRLIMFIYGNSSYLVTAIIGLAINWQLELFGFVISLFFLGLIFFLFIMQTRAAERQTQEDKTPELAIELLEQTRTIQLSTAEENFERKYSSLQKHAMRDDIKIHLNQSFIYAMTQAGVYFFALIAYIRGIGMVYDGSIKSNDLFTVALAIEFLGWSIAFYYPSIPEMLRANIAAGIIYKYYDLPVMVDGSEAKPPLTGSFAVTEVSFAYPCRPSHKVARGLSISASAGESIALVGPSGCGKSTLVALLERFYEQQSGVIKLDGHDHRRLNRAHLRSQIALVGQEPVLFEGSIADNVALGCPSVCLSDVIAACRMANAAAFVEALPQGYETEVGEKGRALSGGQKQRIAIARALIRNPRLLLLDEATSALDAESERLVQEAINAASQGRTSISIAHRLASIKNVDRIYFIEGGRVVEAGSHTYLVEKRGRYAAYVQAQSLTDDA